MKALVAVALLSLVALAGCSGSGPQTPAQDAEGNYLVHMSAGNKFSPMIAKVPVGASVSWVNDGGVHDVTAHDGSWSSDDATSPGLGHKMQKGERYTRTFDQAGEVEYHCVIHASTGMKGTLIVE